MSWQHTTYNGARVDDGTFDPVSLTVAAHHCLQITIDWFDGTPGSNGESASHMESQTRCATVPDGELPQLSMGRFNVPPAVKAKVCLVDTSPIFGRDSRCVISNAFVDNVLTGI
jgi:hypothetical protein